MGRNGRNLAAKLIPAHRRQGDEMTPAEQLLPCPFCGGCATTCEFDNGYFVVGCESCGIDRNNDEDGTGNFDAVAAWNTRAHLSNAATQADDSNGVTQGDRAERSATSPTDPRVESTPLPVVAAPLPDIAPDAATPDEFRWHRCHNKDELEAFYLSRLPAIREAARKCGYAIGVHGSMRRDLDLIAAPWIAEHSDLDTLAKAVQVAACGLASDSYVWGAGDKPCGRAGTVFAVCWTG
jgi:hypothetical protein